MKTLTVFIAGAKNLQPLRLKLKALANDLNNEYRKDGKDLTVNMVSYENFTDRQSDYDKFIVEEADLVLFLLDGRIGEKTEGEYLLTMKANKEHGHPDCYVFLHDFETATPEIKHIEDMMSANSDKYYIQFTNPEDLLAKVKNLIMECSKKASTVKAKPVAPKKSKRGLLVTVACLVLALAAALVFLAGSKSTSYVNFNLSGFPSDLTELGINEKYVESQLMLTANEEAATSQIQLKEIASGFGIPADIVFPSALKSSAPKGIRRSIRKLFGYHDLDADFHLIETNGVITSKLLVNDWNDQSQNYTVEENKDNFSNLQDCILSMIKKNAAYLSISYDPLIAALYDYQPVDELEEYQMVSPWKDEIFSGTDREIMLSEYAEKHPEKAKLCHLLLGDYYEKHGLELNSDKQHLEKALHYYALLKDENVQNDAIDQKMKSLQDYMVSSATPSETTLADLLEKKGIIPAEGADQLIVVTDEESSLIDSKKVYKARLYTFERNAHHQWEEVFPDFKVNLGVNGMVSKEQKKEADLKTPTGYYALPFAFGYAKDIETKLTFVELTKEHVWVCDTSSAAYNTMIVDRDGKYLNNKLNERLFRNDELNRYAIVIDYNTNPIVKGKGSAIFIHVERFENHRTAGCISMPKEKVIQLIQWLDDSKHPHIYISKQVD